MCNLNSRNKLNGIFTACLLHCEIYTEAQAQQGCTVTGVIKMIIVSKELLGFPFSYHDFRYFDSPT